MRVYIVNYFTSEGPPKVIFFSCGDRNFSFLVMSH
jgi:hypothetical protein